MFVVCPNGQRLGFVATPNWWEFRLDGTTCQFDMPFTSFPGPDKNTLKLEFDRHSDIRKIVFNSLDGKVVMLVNDSPLKIQADGNTAFYYNTIDPDHPPKFSLKRLDPSIDLMAYTEEHIVVYDYFLRDPKVRQYWSQFWLE